MIARSKENRRFAKSLEVGLREAVRFARGELTLRTIQVPDPPPKVAGRDVASLRARTGISQAVLARVLNVSTKTVQSWEQGERTPSHAALRMLQVFREDPNFVLKVVGLSARQSRSPTATRRAVAAR
jgi:putative transcriptional regulator